METVQETLGALTKSLGLKELTLAGVLRVAIIVLVGVLVIRMLMKLVDGMLEKSKSLASLHVYIRSVVRVGLYFLLALMVAGSLDVDVSSIIALLSVAGLAVSLALQNTLSNLAGGIMLLVTKPFQVGDYVEADGISGTISATDLSYTTFVTPDSKEVFVPNSQLAGAKIVNYTVLGKRRVDLNFTASYDAPTETVKSAILEAVEEIPAVWQDPAPAVWLSEYQASSIQYVVRVWTAAADYWNVYYALQEGVRESFARHGVEMTYEHLNVHLLER